MASSTSYRSQRTDVISSESSSSSDEEDQLWKRQKRKKHGQPRQAPMAVSDTRPARSMPSSTSTNKRKRNNIWGAVVQAQEEEHVAREMTQFDMHRNRERNVESYNYRRTEAQKKSQPLGNPINLGGDSDIQGRRMPAALGGSNEDSWLVDEERHEDDGRAVRDGSADKAGGGIQDRLGPRTNEEGPSRRMKFFSSSLKAVTIEPDMHRKEVAGKIAYSLQEPHREMVKTVVYELGVEKAIAVWKDTCDIENSGGMMVNTGHRRRTPGGVFFFKIKTDPDISKEKKDIIFAMSRLQSKEDSKNKRKKKRRKARSGRVDSMEVEIKQDETSIDPMAIKVEEMDPVKTMDADASVDGGGVESGHLMDLEMKEEIKVKEETVDFDDGVSVAIRNGAAKMGGEGEIDRGGPGILDVSSTINKQSDESDEDDQSGSSGEEEVEADVGKAIERRLLEIKREKEKSREGGEPQDGGSHGPGDGAQDTIKGSQCVQQQNGGKEDEMEEGEVSD